jgi:hypothetical protein
MFAAVGDRVFVESVRPGHEHRGRIVALRHSDGTPPYVVRWDDTGTETLHFPRADCRIEPAPPAREANPATMSQRVHHWTVVIDVVEHDQYTTAHAVLHEDDAPTVVTGRGESVRRPGDRSIPELGDELAVARALRQLSDRLALAVRNTLVDVEHRDVDLVDLRPARGTTVRETDL